MKIKNWSKFQHFKDRKPPWVKLYRDVLDDMEWYELDPLASKVLVMCWLIASEDDGRLPNSKTLAFRLRMTEKQTIECLNKLSHWLEQDDINEIAKQHQVDSLEKEIETKEETKKETKKIATVVACPRDFDESLWNDWLKIRKSKKAPLTETAWKLFVNETGKAGWTIENAIQECCLRNWASFKAEWVADKQPQGTSFRERDEAEKRRKWEEMTGRKWPTENNTTFIEAEANFLEIGHD